MAKMFDTQYFLLQNLVSGLGVIIIRYQPWYELQEAWIDNHRTPAPDELEGMPLRLWLTVMNPPGPWFQQLTFLHMVAVLDHKNSHKTSSDYSHVWEMPPAYDSFLTAFSKVLWPKSILYSLKTCLNLNAHKQAIFIKSTLLCFHQFQSIMFLSSRS